MLVVTRKAGESIIITTDSGEQVKVTLLQSFPYRAKLGIEAEDSVRINREEVEEKLMKDNVNGGTT